MFQYYVIRMIDFVFQIDLSKNAMYNFVHKFVDLLELWLPVLVGRI